MKNINMYIEGGSHCKSKGYPGSDPNATPYIWFPPASDKNKVPETLPA